MGGEYISDRAEWEVFRTAMSREEDIAMYEFYLLRGVSVTKREVTVITLCISSAVQCSGRNMQWRRPDA